jgi:hypothetical protein
MKALSIQQPWAWLIATGAKDIENRTWRTHYRGTVAIHASRWDNSAPDKINGIIIPEKLWIGCIVGFVDIVDCVTESKSKWFQGPHGFVLKNAREIEPIECKGRLGIWTIPENVENIIKTQMKIKKGAVNAPTIDFD